MNTNQDEPQESECEKIKDAVREYLNLENPYLDFRKDKKLTPTENQSAPLIPDGFCEQQVVIPTILEIHVAQNQMLARFFAKNALTKYLEFYRKQKDSALFCLAIVFEYSPTDENLKELERELTQRDGMRGAIFYPIKVSKLRELGLL